MRWAFQIHDSNHIEVVIYYPITSSTHAPKETKQHRWSFLFKTGFLKKILINRTQKAKIETQTEYYSLDCYMYTPASLTLPQAIFNRESVSSRFKNITRLEPLKLEFCLHGRLPHMERYLELRALLKQKSTIIDSVVAEVKTYAVYLSTLMSHLSPSNIESVYEKIQSFRKEYISKLKNQEFLCHDEILKAFSQVDEFLNHRFIEANHNLATIGSPLPYYEDERRYQKSFSQIQDAPSTQVDRERQIARAGFLKKYVFDVLFLDEIRQKRENFYRNIFASIGAGVAATFANLVNMDNKLSGSYDNSNVQIYAFFTLAVLAYIFKDRLKEFSKEYLNTRFTTKFPHQEGDLYLKRPDFNIGYFRKYFWFRTSDQIPSDIKYLKKRLERESSTVATGFYINHYHKSLELNRSAPALLKTPMVEVKDIHRISFGDLLAHLDDPFRTWDFPSVGGTEEANQAAKVYYFDLIFKMQKKAPMETWDTYFEIIRVVINRNGIMRIESPMNSQIFSFSEGRTPL